MYNGVWFYRQSLQVTFVCFSSSWWSCCSASSKPNESAWCSHSRLGTAWLSQDLWTSWSSVQSRLWTKQVNCLFVLNKLKNVNTWLPMNIFEKYQMVASTKWLQSFLEAFIIMIQRRVKNCASPFRELVTFMYEKKHNNKKDFFILFFFKFFLYFNLNIIKKIWINK